MHQVSVQIAAKSDYIPKNTLIKKWAKVSLCKRQCDVTIRIVTASEMIRLNETYRRKNKPTNVLSFNYGEATDDKLFGDIIICAEVVNEEAQTHNKDKEAYWAHIVIHGMLHLMGYDHELETDAVEMENKERLLMKELSYPDPYSNE